MLDALRRAVPVASPISIDGAVAATTLATFLWLLAHGYIRPLAVYLLELYLAL